MSNVSPSIIPVSLRQTHSKGTQQSLPDSRVNTLLPGVPTTVRLVVDLADAARETTVGTVLLTVVPLSEETGLDTSDGLQGGVDVWSACAYLLAHVAGGWVGGAGGRLIGHCV